MRALDLHLNQMDTRQYQSMDIDKKKDGVSLHECGISAKSTDLGYI